ncbi:hypothetical protein GCM10007967_06700 [Xylanimonas ulmi]
MAGTSALRLVRHAGTRVLGGPRRLVMWHGAARVRFLGLTQREVALALGLTIARVRQLTAAPTEKPEPDRAGIAALCRR